MILSGRIMYVTKVEIDPMTDNRQAGDRKGVTSYEVTPEMIDAGVASYLEWCPDSGCGDEVDRRMVADIFAAMQDKRQSAEVGSNRWCACALPKRGP